MANCFSPSRAASAAWVPKPGDLVVMDNLSSHKVVGFARPSKPRGSAELRYLPLLAGSESDRVGVLQVQEIAHDGAERTVDKLWKLCGTILDQFTESECRNYPNTADTATPKMKPL